MSDPFPIQLLEAVLCKAISQNCRIDRITPIGGGCIHHALKVESSVGTFFTKWNTADAIGMFEAEVDGLLCLSGKSPLKIPSPIVCSVIENYALLILEYLPQQPYTQGYWSALGSGIAILHTNTENNFGYHRDNFIGALPQRNRWHSQLPEFFIEERLKPQVALAQRTGFLDTATAKKFDTLYERLPTLLPDEPPALLHGDLWSGNCFPTTGGLAAVVDPAVYYGAREAEISFTCLFGGFDPEFYRAYEEVFPLLPDWKSRIDLYNLYPLLVHLNLFGSSYLPAIHRILKKYA